MKIALVLGLLLLTVLIAGCQDNSLGKAMVGVGKVYVLTNPAGAKVSLMGAYCGVSPVYCYGPSSVTALTVTASKAGYYDSATKVLISHGKTSTASMTLRERPVCNDGVVASTETCDPPNVPSSLQCYQGGPQCDSKTHKYGTTFKAYGNCNAQCQCVKDPITNWACVLGKCGATAASEGDCTPPSVFKPNACSCCTPGPRCLDATHWTNDNCLGTSTVQTCNGGCTDNHCTSTICNEKDGGNDRFVYSTITSTLYIDGRYYGVSAGSDSCADAATVRELYCDPNLAYGNIGFGIGQVDLPCPAGTTCVAGACVRSASSCTEGWKCKDATHWGYQEASCAFSTLIPCPSICNGEVCHDCRDPDGGLRPNTASTVTAYEYDSSTAETNPHVAVYSDECFGNTGTVREYACGPNQGTPIPATDIVYKDYGCVYGCAKGACLASIPPPPSG